jgi:hypothetical protein
LPKGEFLTIPGGHHADLLFFRDGSAALFARIVAFAKRAP